MTLNIVHSLSKETRQLVESLADAFQHKTGTQLQQIIMKLDAFIKAQDEYNASNAAAVTGLTGDIDGLKSEIQTLRDSLGDTPTPEQLASLDRLDANARDFAARLANLDSLTPPAASELKAPKE